MIFVTVGTTDFDALVSCVDRLSPHLDQPVVMQIGAGRYVPRNAAEHFRFAPSLEPYYERASLVISHGGLGTLVEAMRRGKPLIGVSNPQRYDRHQEDLLSYLEEQGHLLWCRDLDQLGDDLNRAAQMSFIAYPEPRCEIHDVINAYLEGISHPSS